MITFVPVTEADAALICEWQSDFTFVVMSSMSMRRPDVDQIIKDIQIVVQDELQTYDLIKVDEVPVGYIRIGHYLKLSDRVAYKYLELIKDSCWLSYTIAEAHRGKGYAKTALQALFASSKLNGYKRMYAYVYEHNLVSRHILTSLGFVKLPEQPIYCKQLESFDDREK